MADRTLQLAEDWRPGLRLGRNVHHDPRSLRYLVQPPGVVQTKIWVRKIPILDQGNIRSCTGNATVGALGTGPLYDALTPVQRNALNEDEAVRIYSLATQLDPFQGTYPPTDSGSDGLDAAKAAQKLGYLSGYQHITSIAAAQTAIVSGPFIVGTNWYSSMDNPDADGVVTVGGTVRGGHEYCCFGFDAEADLWHFANSWGTSWGKDGTFAYSTASFQKLLAQQGDATVLVPISQPAPTPTPPTPAPSVIPADILAWARLAVTQGWRSHHDRTVAQEIIGLAGQ
ncbi:MAG: C1 family peptidase [Frankiaceae bacterium]